MGYSLSADIGTCCRVYDLSGGGASRDGERERENKYIGGGPVPLECSLGS